MTGQQRGPARCDHPRPSDHGYSSHLPDPLRRPRGRLVITAAALQNWWLVIGVSVSALGVYSLTRLGGSSVAQWIVAGHEAIGMAAAVLLAIVCGFAVPTFLASTDRRGRRAKALAVFTGVLASAFIAEVNLNALPVQLFLRTDLWFAAGVAAFVVLKSQFYEREGDPTPADDWWDEQTRRDKRRTG